MNLNLLTAATEQAPEVVEEAFNLAEWMGNNPVVVYSILFGIGLVTAVACYFAKRKGRK